MSCFWTKCGWIYCQCSHGAQVTGQRGDRQNPPRMEVVTVKRIWLKDVGFHSQAYRQGTTQCPVRFIIANKCSPCPCSFLLNFCVCAGTVGSCFHSGGYGFVLLSNGTNLIEIGKWIRYRSTSGGDGGGDGGVSVWGGLMMPPPVLQLAPKWFDTGGRYKRVDQLGDLQSNFRSDRVFLQAGPTCSLAW